MCLNLSVQFLCHKLRPQKIHLHLLSRFCVAIYDSKKSVWIFRPFFGVAIYDSKNRFESSVQVLCSNLRQQNLAAFFEKREWKKTLARRTLKLSCSCFEGTVSLYVFNILSLPACVFLITHIVPSACGVYGVCFHIYLLYSVVDWLVGWSGFARVKVWALKMIFFSFSGSSKLASVSERSPYLKGRPRN